VVALTATLRIWKTAQTVRTEVLGTVPVFWRASSVSRDGAGLATVKTERARTNSKEERSYMLWDGLVSWWTGYELLRRTTKNQPLVWGFHTSSMKQSLAVAGKILERTWSEGSAREETIALLSIGVCFCGAPSLWSAKRSRKFIEGRETMLNLKVSIMQVFALFFIFSI
jgi:hypothetical protein